MEQEWSSGLIPPWRLAGDLAPVVFLPLEGFNTQEKSSQEFTSTLYPTLSALQTWASLLILLWTRMPELDVSDVSQLFPAPHILKASPTCDNFLELQLPVCRLEG